MRPARRAGRGQLLNPISPCSSLPPAQSAGLNILLQGKTAQVTLLVPINSGGCWVLQRCVWSWAWDAPAWSAADASLNLFLLFLLPPSSYHPSPSAALSAGVDARPLRAERNLSELVLNAPEIINPLVGYHGECCCTALSGAALSGAALSGAAIRSTMLLHCSLAITASGGRASQLACRGWAGGWHGILLLHQTLPLHLRVLVCSREIMPAVLPRLWPSSSLLPGTAIDTVSAVAVVAP